MKKNKTSIGTKLTFIILIIFSILCIYPIIWLLLNSFKDNSEIFTNPWGLPKVISFVNYERAIVVGNVGINFLNSVFITVVSVFVAVLLSCMASYGIVRMKWRMSRLLYFLFLIGMSIPSYSAIVPLFNMFNKMGIINKYPAIIIPHIAFALPISIFILSGFFSSILKEMEEAAIIDGCSIIGVFFRIIIPISISSIVTVTVINFINIWNDLLFPQIFLSDINMMPLPVGLTAFSDLYSTDYSGMIAAVIFTIIPTIVAYIFLHNKIMDGMTAGAVKG
ncbi:carbohydrate ABC transporter membrane protein 2 (CUT1 family) [Anaerobacterium chartisolvens]|uniref:Carbohydrate ABC transporter membrane protein 2 (CUT1 family) n=1 Tax=Anaerobacterium chartisolvens TaxID=1297424 RepID=A0A369AQC8_9FIRM|nr:carbohydrate ABC transporter permease [Anaerobacterium chartisolvens]RCX10538.1 carbohydrate ABC transporter membrane protein 2 (CUT1 family) [Anaerobacterium chartisolvens]